MSASAYALELINLTKNFSGIVAADDISIQIEAGRIYGVIGPNGAGKTTMFNMITGVYVPSSGDIKLFGRSIAGKPTHEIANLGIARTFQNIRLFNDLSIYQNVLTSCQQNLNYTFAGGIFKTKKYREQEKAAGEFCLKLLESIGLLEAKDQLAHNLPYGLQRRLEIVRALATRPKVLLLDEPSAGMNEEESAALMEIIRDIRDEYGLTIVIIDHHMEVIMNVCERISVLNFGQLLATGTTDEIQTNQAVIDAYLGVEETC